MGGVVSLAGLVVDLAWWLLSDKLFTSDLGCWCDGVVVFCLVWGGVFLLSG